MVGTTATKILIYITLCLITINHRDLSLNYAIIKGISWENQFDMILGCVRKWSIPPNLRLLDDNMALYDAK